MYESTQVLPLKDSSLLGKSPIFAGSFYHIHTHAQMHTYIYILHTIYYKRRGDCKQLHHSVCIHNVCIHTHTVDHIHAHAQRHSNKFIALRTIDHRGDSERLNYNLCERTHAIDHKSGGISEPLHHNAKQTVASAHQCNRRC